ncbi:pyridoxamine 5'-phosphate oxidase family protein [Streptomyces fructofermentans]|uniref:Pyridoxamine 5'-phosphate oxidase n=1 Tax=Streptomyces fructofermentans TaxID=152141 RepID=A0A918K4U3_9ACTN|nr:pyridoxamine 5'-phosphate oxidase family protein [Streptomyces fructofermentans]GGX46405.1 pyridoxamine 5'-phosphate oxidase [Streptomyces fructofermentans]
MALSRDEREKFLAQPHVAAFSVDGGAGRAPLTVPIWYQYEADGTVWVMTGRDSRKNRLIEAAGRFSLMVDRLEPTIRYVSVEGPVLESVPATREQLVEISARYLPADKVDAYVDVAWKEHGAQVVVRMRPEHWLSADLGSL